MSSTLKIVNSYTREKEEFQPINPPFVGLYVCGPTVYGDPHLGHARPYTTFDVVYRYLTYLGYKVRYVRNITDVGHLENDADEGEDKIAKKARLEQLEPMEVVQHYTNRFHNAMDALNNIPPSIEPSASGHIIEQIQMIEGILKNGYAYEVNGSVYFDVPKFSKDFPYGKLSGRNIDDMLAVTRELDGTEDKKHPADFALWKKAEPTHIMRWPSPWGDGFPGWHLECSAMSTKYLGETFDIHGGGMDLQFPHHEAEIAQSQACNHSSPAKVWMHNNMITINGRKMGKSLGNFITLEEFFTGTHDALEQAYSPLTVRFFILQAHYRSTLDFSNDALKAAEKALQKLQATYETLLLINANSDTTDFDIETFKAKCFDALNDDFNTSMVLAEFFELSRFINSAATGKAKLSEEGLTQIREAYKLFFEDILGLKRAEQSTTADLSSDLMETILKLRHEARFKKDFATSDFIRDELGKLGITVKDGKDGATWEMG